MKPTEIILAFATLVAIASCTQSTTPTCIVEGNQTGLEGDGWVYMTDMCCNISSNLHPHRLLNRPDHWTRTL